MAKLLKLFPSNGREHECNLSPLLSNGVLKVCFHKPIISNSEDFPIIQFSSVQFSRSVVSDSLRPHESQHTRPPCLSRTPRVHSDSHPLAKVKPDFHLKISLAYTLHEFRSDQSLSCVRLFATPWITARQASLFITNSRSSLRLASIESVMSSSHLILSCPLLLLPPIPPSISLFQWVNSSHEVAKVLEFQL